MIFVFFALGRHTQKLLGKMRYSKGGQVGYVLCLLKGEWADFSVSIFVLSNKKGGRIGKIAYVRYTLFFYLRTEDGDDGG